MWHREQYDRLNAVGKPPYSRQVVRAIPQPRQAILIASYWGTPLLALTQTALSGGDPCCAAVWTQLMNGLSTSGHGHRTRRKYWSSPFGTALSTSGPNFWKQSGIISAVGNGLRPVYD